MKDKSCIEVDNLQKKFGKIKAVNGISFNVEKGIVFGMLGPNGAGKTTTIETLAGLYSRDGGQINILGLDPEQDKDKLREIIGVQLQSPALFEKLKVEELISLFASFYPNSFPVERAIKMVDLESKKNVRTDSLSGGQRHRLAVALAIVSNGEILFLDEPTTGLDPQSRRKLWEVIKELKEMGKTIFLTTHYMEEAEVLCDKLLIIDQGQVIARGSPAKLIKDNFKENTIEIINSSFSEEEIGALAGLSGVVRQNIDEKRKIKLYTTDVVKTISDLFSYTNKINKPLDNLNIRKPTLEDLFIKLTGRKIRQ